MASPIHSALVGRRRTCPRCGHRQLVAIMLSRETVVCRRCGAHIPPAPASATTGSSAPTSPRKPRP